MYSTCFLFPVSCHISCFLFLFILPVSCSCRTSGYAHVSWDTQGINAVIVMMVTMTTERGSVLVSDCLGCVLTLF